MRPAIPNPAWSNCALLRSWDAIEAHVGARMMPKVTAHTLDRLKAVEYGHGVYGVVMPTQAGVGSGAIVKVTSDPTEAHFVSIYRSLSRKPDGVVKYGPIWKLPGKHDHRPLFVLWREEASDVGHVLDEHKPQDAEAIRLLDAIFDETIPTCQVACSTETSPEELASVREAARSYVRKTGYEHGSRPGMFDSLGRAVSGRDNRAGFGAAAAVTLAQQLERIPKMAAIGRSILMLARDSIIVSDLHLGNFGYVNRNGRKVAVITDPGNVAILTTKYDKTWPKEIEAGLPRKLRKKMARQPVRCAR